MQWIKQWAERRRLRQRALFQYRDGTRTRYADPAVVWRAILNHPRYDFSAVSKLAGVGQEPEHSQLLEIVADAFRVQRWNEVDRSGLTEWELLELLGQFDRYLEALKKNISPSRMPLQLSVYGQSISSAPVSAETNAEPTSSSSVSSCSPIESSTDAGIPSCEPSPMA